MLKQFFIDTGIVNDEEEFKEVMEVTTSNIKANRTMLGKRTSILDVIQVAEIVAYTLRRCKEVVWNMNGLPDSMYDYRHEQKKAEVVDVCMVCSRYIVEGESYYDFSGDIVCKDCLSDYVKEHKTR